MRPLSPCGEKGSDRPIKVLHTITGLLVGGSEMMLYKFLAASDRDRFPAAVVVLTKPGPLTEAIRDLGVEVTHLNVRRGRLPNPSALARLYKISRTFDPQVVQGWMYHGNLTAWLASRFLPGRRILAWNHGQSLYDIKLESKITRLAIRAEIPLSPRADVLITNTHLGLRQHMAKGYRPRKAVVISNGFDLDQFRPDKDMKASVLQELGVDSKCLLVGLVGRDHPLKDLPNFLNTAVKVRHQKPDVHFIIAGKGWRHDDPGPSGLVHKLGAGQYIHLLGPRKDIPRLMAAFDVTVSSSWSEGSPNVIGEAMAAGTPCVVTDAGDSGLLVGDTGIVVPRGDSTALAEGVLELLNMPEDQRRALGQKARRKMEAHYSIASVARQQEDLYRDLVTTAGI